LDNILNNIHSSGYYISALERLKRNKFKTVKSPLKHNPNELSPEPPLVVGRYETLNLNEVKKYRNANKSDFSSGPLANSQHNRSSAVLETGSCQEALHSNQNITANIRNLNDSKRLEFSDGDMMSPKESAQAAASPPPVIKTSTKALKKSLLTSKLRVQPKINGEEPNTETLKSLIDNYFQRQIQ